MSEQQKLERLLAQGKISRREFLTRMSALGLVVAVPSLMSDSAFAAKKGGKFVVGIGHGSTTDAMDPGTYENDFTISSSFCRNNYLTSSIR